MRTEVGIADCLHIDVEWNKEKYHLREVIFGNVSFLKVRIKIKSMEIALLRREKAGNGENLRPSSASGGVKGRYVLFIYIIFSACTHVWHIMSAKS